MKVALVYLGRRGAGTKYSLEMAKNLSDKVDLQSFVSSNVDNLNDWGNFGLKTVNIPTYNSLLGFIITLLFPLRIIKAVFYIRKFNPDVIYYPMLHYWAPIINYFFYKTPIVSTIHDPKPHLGEESWAYRKLLHFSLKQSSRVIILSEVFIPAIASYGFPESNITVIPHSQFNYGNTPRSTSTRTFKNTVLFFGRISKYKGVEVLLKAFKIVEETNQGVHLLIVGSGDVTQYENMLVGMKNVELINRWVDDDEIECFFNRADFLVAPYIDASQSGVIMAAYGFGIPVVASRIGGIPEQVVDMKTGLLVEPGNDIDLAHKCRMLLSNPDLILTMGRAAIDYANREFDWDSAAKKAMDCFERC